MAVSFSKHYSGHLSIVSASFVSPFPTAPWSLVLVLQYVYRLVLCVWLVWLLERAPMAVLDNATDSGLGFQLAE
jgi:hypothetical protein